MTPRRSAPFALRLAGALAILAIGCSGAGCSGGGPAEVQPPRAGDAPVLVPLPGPSRVTRAGDVVVKSAADLAALAGVQVLEGRLTIVATDLRDLSGLDALERVGALRIARNPALASLHGLERLAHVGGDLALEDAPRLASLDALGALAGVGGELRLAPSEPDPAPAPARVGLTSAALPSLRSLGALDLRDAPALGSLELPLLDGVEGGFSVLGAPLLRELAAPRLTRVGGALRIGRARAPGIGEGNGQNLALERILLPELASVDALVVEACPALRELAAPALFDVVHDLSLDIDASRGPQAFDPPMRIALPRVHVVGRDAVVALRGGVLDLALPLERVGRDLVVGEGGATALGILSRVEGAVRVVGWRGGRLRLSGLQKAGVLDLHDPGVDDVELPALTELQRVSLEGSGVTSLALPALTRLEALVVRNEPRLGRLQLGAVNGGAAAISIAGCPALVELDLRALAESASFSLASSGVAIGTLRLDALTRVRGDVVILDGLVDVGSLSALVRVDGGLKLWLTRGDKEAIEAFVARISVGGTVDARAL